jgi:hypothetical protein
MAILRLLQVQTILRLPPPPSTTIRVPNPRAPATMLITAVLSIVITTVEAIATANAASITPLNPCASPCAHPSLPQLLVTLLRNLRPSSRTKAIVEATRPSHQHRIVHARRLYAGKPSVASTIRFPKPECPRQIRVPSMNTRSTAVVTMTRTAVKPVPSTSTVATQVTEHPPPLRVLTCVVSTPVIMPLMLLHALRLPSAAHSTRSITQSCISLFSDSRYAIFRSFPFSEAYKWHMTLLSRFIASFSSYQHDTPLFLKARLTSVCCVMFSFS